MVANNVTSMSRISISTTGRPGNIASILPEISGDGRFITFTSQSTTLDPTGGSNGDFSHVYLRDTLTGTTTLVTMGFDGTPAYTGGGYSSVSNDGRFVCFVSYPGEFVQGENAAGSETIYVRDMASGTTISIPQVVPGGATLGDPHMSGDGRYVVYWQGGDVYRYDLLTRQTENASLPITGVVANGGSYFGDVSHDGRYVVFMSDATNLLDLDGNDDNGANDIFLRDMATGALARVSLTDADGQINGHSSDAAVSDNGRYVVFTSAASNLIAGPSSGHDQIFIRDTVANTTKIVSAATGAIQGDGDSSSADVSANGRYVVFTSESDDLVAGDVNGLSDVFLRDMVTGSMVMLSKAASGGVSNGASNDAHISADGRYVTFTSAASNLTPGDSNNTADIFRVSLFATNATDILIGGDGADSISGLGGDDIISGGFGADSMAGGAGSDTYYVENAGDKVTEAAGGGFDKVLSYVNYVLTAGSEVELLTTNDTAGEGAINLTGNALRQEIIGNAGVNTLKDGGGAGDLLRGMAGNDTYLVYASSTTIVEGSGQGTADRVLAAVNYKLGAGVSIEQMQTTSSTGTTGINLTGNDFVQKIVGNAGTNLIDGKGGNDTLYGGSGKDYFTFTTALDDASNVDTISDFNAADDTIRLENAIFTALTATGALASGFFRANATGTAQDANDFIVYETDTGKLFYDADANGAGAAVQFALLTGHPTITAADFTVI
jgi:Ca2+-binding RTX toxin-like protein